MLTVVQGRGQAESILIFSLNLFVELAVKLLISKFTIETT